MRRRLTREKMTCVPEEPMSMPTLTSETWSAIHSGFSSSGPSSSK
jgi:hypothetical protein